MEYICLQENEFDCGYACLKMCLSYAYKDRKYLNLERNYTKNAYSFTDLKKIASKFSMELEGVEVTTKEEIFKHPNSIVQLNDNNISHFVLFVRKYKNYVIVNDPNFGQIKMEINEFLLLFTGYSLIIKKCVKNKIKVKRRLLNLNYIILYLTFLILDFGLIYLFSFISSNSEKQNIYLTIVTAVLICFSCFSKGYILLGQNKAYDNEVKEILDVAEKKNIKLSSNELTLILTLKGKIIQYVYGTLNDLFVLIFISCILINNGIMHIFILVGIIISMFASKQILLLNKNTKKYELTKLENQFINTNTSFNLTSIYTKLNKVGNSYVIEEGIQSYLFYLLIAIVVIIMNYISNINSFVYISLFIGYYLIFMDRFKHLLNLNFDTRLEYNKLRNFYLDLKKYILNKVAIEK